METNDRFARQSGEDAPSHVARMARELWGCVDDLKRTSIPAVERSVGDLRRDLERMGYERASDARVHAEEQKATISWRNDTRKRLERLEEQVDKIRVAAGLPQAKSSIFEVDMKTLVIVAIAVGGVVFEILRRSVGQ